MISSKPRELRGTVGLTCLDILPCPCGLHRSTPRSRAPVVGRAWKIDHPQPSDISPSQSDFSRQTTQAIFETPTHLVMKSSHPAYPSTLLEGVDFDAKLEYHSFEPLVNILQKLTVDIQCPDDPLVRLSKREPGNVGSDFAQCSVRTPTVRCAKEYDEFRSSLARLGLT